MMSGAHGLVARERGAPLDGVPATEAAEDLGFQERIHDAFARALLEPVAAMASMLPRDSVVHPQDSERAIATVTEALRDLLEYVEYQVGRGVPIVRRRADLTLLCERVVDSIQDTYPENPIAFSSSCAVEGEWDPGRIASLVSRLIVDAIERGPVRRVVRVSLRRIIGNRAIIEVSTGPSKSSEPLASRIEPFARVDWPTSCTMPRLGLGLYLAHEIARAHGGTVELLEDAGAGTTLRATLPCL